jgi:phosphatidylserine/phosphatidylglycerophosphate/cardiolipin synthase-like enzyme
MSKRSLLGLVLLSLCLPGCRPAPAQTADQAAQSLPPIEVHFSPKGGCTEAVVKELGNAKSTVLVQAYSFTSVPIAKALVDAFHRGVKVEVILDKSQKGEKYSSADFVINAGIPTKIDAKHAIAHNKIMVIDGQTVITGSFNFTKAAEENNAENLLVIRSPELAAKYAANWQAHAAHSDPYESRTQGYSETHRAAAEPPKTDAVAGGYVASSRSQVFHRPSCKGAAKISEKNLVHYATRDEAIQAGKKPCPECNP